MTDTKIKPDPEDFAKGNLDFCVEYGGIPDQLKEIETDDVIAGHLYRLAEQAKVIRLAEKEMETDDATAGHLYRLAQGAKAWPEDEAIPVDDPVRNRLEQD